MRVRVKSLPQDRELEGFDLSRFEVGQVYDVGQRLGELLIVLGHAVPDMRREQQDRAADESERRGKQ